MIKLIPSLEMLEDILRTIRIQDVLDILIVAYLVYKLIDLLRETRAGQLIKGVLGIILVYVLSQAFQLRAVSAIIRYLITYGVFALLIIFQPELRKILEKLGRTSFSLTQLRKTVNSIGGNSFENNSNMMRCINAICDSCAVLSKERTGALIVIERSTRLGDIIATGTLVDASPSAELIRNIFFKNSPLHDGAMVIRDGRVHAAGCFLPLALMPEEFSWIAPFTPVGQGLRLCAALFGEQLSAAQLWQPWAMGVLLYLAAAVFWRRGEVAE